MLAGIALAFARALGDFGATHDEREAEELADVLITYDHGTVASVEHR